MTKRILAIAIALMTLVAGASFATDGNFNETGLPIVNEKIEVRVAVTRFSLDATKSYDEKHFVIDAEEATNIHVNWEEIGGDATERMNVMLAGGDLPDLFIGPVGVNIITQNTKLFMPLNDLLPQYAPITYQYYQDKLPYWQSYLTYPDGNIYGLMGSFVQAYPMHVDSLPWINQAWLDNVGLTAPTTADELYNVLVAFRDQDANGNGDPSDEIPFDFTQSHYAAHFDNLMVMFGMPAVANNNGYYDIVDGKVIPTANTAAYREFLEFMHKLGSEGLTNLEGFSQTEDQYFSNIDSNKVGFFYGWMPGTFTSNKELVDQFHYLEPIAAQGYTPRVAARQAAPNRTSFVLSSTTKYAKELLRWWDYLGRDTGSKLFTAYGDEGIIFKKNEEDGLFYSYTPTPEEMIAHGYGDYIDSIGTSKNAGSFGLINYHPAVETTKSVTISPRMAALLSIQEYTMPPMSLGVIPADKTEEFTFTTEGLGDAIKAYAASTFMNGVTDASWNAYLTEISNLNYDYYIQYFQDYLDGKFVQ